MGRAKYNVLWWEFEFLSKYVQHLTQILTFFKEKETQHKNIPKTYSDEFYVFNEIIDSIFKKENSCL